MTNISYWEGILGHSKYSHYIIYALDYKTGKKKRLFGGEGNVPALIGNRRI